MTINENNFNENGYILCPVCNGTGYGPNMDFYTNSDMCIEETLRKTGMHYCKYCNNIKKIDWVEYSMGKRFNEECTDEDLSEIESIINQFVIMNTFYDLDLIIDQAWMTDDDDNPDYRRKYINDFLLSVIYSIDCCSLPLDLDYECSKDILKLNLHDCFDIDVYISQALFSYFDNSKKEYVVSNIFTFLDDNLINGFISSNVVNECRDRLIHYGYDIDDNEKLSYIIEKLRYWVLNEEDDDPVFNYNNINKIINKIKDAEESSIKSTEELVNVGLLLAA